MEHCPTGKPSHQSERTLPEQKDGRFYPTIKCGEEGQNDSINGQNFTPTTKISSYNGVLFTVIGVWFMNISLNFVRLGVLLYTHITCP